MEFPSDMNVEGNLLEKHFCSKNWLVDFILLLLPNFFIIILELKVHKIENFFDSDFGICIISLIVMSKY
jgi:hypothetical protein